MSNMYLSGNAKRLSFLRCPKCGGPCDAWTGIGEREPAVPTPGSISMCVTCGTILVFTESLATTRALSLRVATDAEVERVRTDPDPKMQYLWKIVQDVVAKWRSGLRHVGNG